MKREMKQNRTDRQHNSGNNRQNENAPTGAVLLVRCEEPDGGACREAPCRLSCKKDALAFVAGDVLVNTGLCTGCPEKGQGEGSEQLPGCIDRCAAAPQKTINTSSPDEKRRRAAQGLY